MVARFALICTRKMHAPQERRSKGSTYSAPGGKRPFTPSVNEPPLAWTEALTLISQSHVSDELYNEARRHFDEKELVNLSLAITTINGWNRWAIGFGTAVGWYQPGMVEAWIKAA